jgi:hypothetical protein
VKRVSHVLVVFTLVALIADTAAAQRSGRRMPQGGPSASDLLKPPVPKDDEEKGILDAIAAMHEGPRYANVSDPDYIKEITTNPQFETLFLLMEGAGVGVTMKKR